MGPSWTGAALAVSCLCGSFTGAAFALPASAIVVNAKGEVHFVHTGEVITRNVGFAIIRVEKYFTIDEVVFAEPSDVLLLGARTLKGLNLTVNSREKRLFAAGPMPAA